MTYIIAEAGSCHDGDLEKANALIRLAAQCGVDAVKFQWTSDPDAMAKRRGRAMEDGYVDHYRRYLAFPETWHPILAGWCDNHGLDYLCTTYLSQDIAVVAPHVAGFKISSFEAHDESFIQAHEPFGKDVYISYGMTSRIDVSALSVPVYRLHCVSAYPAPLNQLNLAVIRQENLDGFSDHSEPEHTMTGSWAVAAGASVLEAHFRLVHTSKDNPDTPHAMLAPQLSDYVHQVRMVEQALGDGIKRVMPCEDSMLRYKVRANINK